MKYTLKMIAKYIIKYYFNINKATYIFLKLKNF